MTTEERELIAQAYDQNVLKVLVATCSLAAGVNLPARRVIINGARMGRELVGPAMLYAFHSMQRYDSQLTNTDDRCAAEPVAKEKMMPERHISYAENQTYRPSVTY